jgi:[acyl-carrier-protein] S-malonyltransferase
VSEAIRHHGGEDDVPYQVSVFASSVTLLERLREAGVQPDVVAGHSLGEYAAAHAAGSISLDDAVRLVFERDRLMNEAASRNPGEMMALIGADVRAVVDAVDAFPVERGIVAAANYNTPRQTVISGEKAALEEISDAVGGRAVPLDVAGAFHSPLMLEASLAMVRFIDEVDVLEPELPMVSATDGAVLARSDDVRLALREQMLSPVRWVAVIERFRDLGVQEIVECGEGGTLIRMLRDFKDVDLKGVVAKERIG